MHAPCTCACAIRYANPERSTKNRDRDRRTASLSAAEGLPTGQDEDRLGTQLPNCPVPISAPVISGLLSASGSPTQQVKRRGIRISDQRTKSEARLASAMATETVLVSTTCEGCSVHTQKSLRCRFSGQGVDVPASLDFQSNTISCCVPSSVRTLSEVHSLSAPSLQGSCVGLKRDCFLQE